MISETVALTLDSWALLSLARLREATGLDNSEVLSNAIGIYVAALEEHEEGNKLAIVKPSGEIVCGVNCRFIDAGDSCQQP